MDDNASRAEKALSEIHKMMCRGEGHNTIEMTRDCIISKWISIGMELKENEELINELHDHIMDLHGK